uniref:Uncharacterized protein n=1 Tax=Rhizophora mucronata TaxID=61149 RepID=A0A2P2NE81_RHIMU
MAPVKLLCHRFRTSNSGSSAMKSGISPCKLLRNRFKRES